MHQEQSMKKIICFVLTICTIFLLTSCYTTNNNNTNSTNNDKNNITDTSTNIPEPKYYTIKFDTNGGTSVQSKTIETLNYAPTTTREGYLFNGWYLDEGLTTAAIFPLSIDNDMTIYANWLKISDKSRCKDVSIKWDKDHDSSVLWYITPSGFDLDELSKREYNLEITVTYNVYYKKDYNVLWDVGYAGSPKYEAFILNSDNVGVIKENLTTNLEADTRKMTYKIQTSDLKHSSIKLKFSTDNIQNIIYFEDIVVTYEFKK